LAFSASLTATGFRNWTFELPVANAGDRAEFLDRAATDRLATPFGHSGAKLNKRRIDLI
jgi:hypothetical protein